MVSTRKKKHQHEKQLSQLDKTLNNFVIRNSTKASAIGDETLEPQNNSCSKNFGRFVVVESSECQNQVIDNNIDDK